MKLTKFLSTSEERLSVNEVSNLDNNTVVYVTYMDFAGIHSMLAVKKENKLYDMFGSEFGLIKDYAQHPYLGVYAVES